MTRYKEFDSILFVCELNAIRSAIAEYYLKSFDIKSRISSVKKKVIIE